MMFVVGRGGGGGAQSQELFYTLLNGRKRVAWMLDWQAVWAVPFFIHRAYRGFGVKVVSE